MISAINNTGNQTTFTSVVPVRVRIDGLETFDEKVIRSACRQLSNILAGPTKETEAKKIATIRAFGSVDPDYNILYGISGYPKKWDEKNIQPSNYFRYICDERKRNFFVSGKQAEKLQELGHSIGTERKVCKGRNIPNSFDLQVAYGNYWGAIKNFLRNKSLRLTESFNSMNNEKSGNPVTLIIDMVSNKKYGLSTFKMKFDNITFEKQ